MGASEEIPQLQNGSDSQHFVTHCQDQSCVIRLPATLTVVDAVTFEATVRNLYSQSPRLEKLTLDFGQTWFIDSSGLGALAICLRHSRQHQFQLVLRNVQSQVQMALEMTDLDRHFTFETVAPGNADAALMPVASEPDAPPRVHPSVTSWGKRLMDIAGAIIGLGITATVAVPIAIAIKLEDGGPVLFSQTRCSWMGRPFCLWKFRSMVVNAESLKRQVTNEVSGPLFKNRNDPRITRVGRFLRRTSLDELPQFWNVLKGDMSLVGTRPPTPDELEQYAIPEWQRLDVKPGMTGEWQVNGRSNITRFEDVIEMDLAYQRKWSLLYDIKLILKTVFVLLSLRSGAS